jgi:uncharacterized phage protein (TIGR02218 family)
MRSDGASIESHTAGEVTTTATCWKVTLRDSTVLGFTDHDAPITFGGVTYQATTGYTASAIEGKNGLEPDNLELLGVIDGISVVSSELRAGRWDYAQVEITMVNWADPTAGQIILRKGRLGEISQGRTRFQAELFGLSKNLQQRVGRLYTPSCDADLGDSRCGIVLATFPRGTVAGTLTGVSSRRVMTDSGLTDGSGWFSGGTIIFTAGANLNIRREIKDYASGGVITLQEGFPYLPVVGDAYIIQAGCDKSAATCASKFDNFVNFQGFPTLPGTDRVLTGK